MPLKSLKIGNNAPRVDILGVEVADISQNSAIAQILKFARDKRDGHIVVTINSEFVMLAKRDAQFGQILKNADLSVADGMGVVFAKLICGGKENVRITGVDLVEKLCEKCAKSNIRIGFLGGFGRVAEIVAKRQVEKYPNLKVVFSQEGNPAIGYDLKLRAAIGTVEKIDILFVAFGMKAQEVWIARNAKKLKVGVFIGVGGALDYLAGVKMRSPKLLQNSGLEWLWRLVLDPARVWRMRVLPAFLVLVMLKSLGLKLGNISKPIKVQNH